MKRGIIAGSFDLLHPGHINTFARCKDYCDYLIVCLQVDPSQERPKKNKPVQTVFERFIQLDACRHVDVIVPYEAEEDLMNIFKMLKIDIRFTGADYKDRKDQITGIDILPIKFIKRDHNYSSGSLRKRIEG